MTHLSQCVLHEVVLEDHLEASAVLECSNMSSNGHAFECPYDSATSWVVLIDSLLLGVFQGAGYL